MIVFNTPSNRETAGPRVAAFGSCRLRHPIDGLVDLELIRISNSGLKEVHSILEVNQSLSFIEGERPISDNCSDFIFETPFAPEISQFSRALNSGIDIFVVEISDNKQFVFHDLIFQQNFFTRRFVRAHGEILLPWFRAVSSGTRLDEDEIGKTIDRLRQSGFTPDELTDDLLRNVRLTRSNGAEMGAVLAALMAKYGGKWIVIGAMTVADAPGALMRDRRSLNANLGQACLECGAMFFDPSDLIERHGRSVALDADGANINEWSPSFYPTVGQNLLRLIEQVVHPQPETTLPIDDPKDWTRRKNVRQLRSARADRINAELISLHKRRVAEFGAGESGLSAYYERSLAQRTLISPRDRTAHLLIDDYLPRYETIGILRAGIGELAFLLAAGGHRVVAYEPGEKRRQAIEAGLEHMEAAGLIEPGTMTIADTLTPDPGAAGRTLGVGLDVSEYRDDGPAGVHVARSAAFEALLIDPRLFMRLRESEAEQQAIIDQLMHMGFEQRVEFFADRLVWLHRP